MPLSLAPRRLLLLLSFLAFAVGTTAQAQDLRVDAGGGWAPATSEIDFAAQGDRGPPPVGLGSGRHVYASIGAVWRLSDLFDLAGRLRAQASRYGVNTEDITGACVSDCSVSQVSDGQIRALTVEGRIILTTLDPFDLYFLVGLGAVRTTVDEVQIDFESGQTDRLQSVDVTDAGGDVGIGASLRLTGGLYLDAEVRATGSLPGSKENAVTVLPLSLGLGYRFGGS